MIITIGGECGSGSKESAQKAAELLGYKLYDEEIITAAFENGCSELDESTLRFYDESVGEGSVDDIAELSQVQRGVSNLIKSLSKDVLPLDLRLDAAIRGAINKLADGDNCIFIGHCANYYLRNRGNVITTYFADKEDNKVKRVANRFDIDVETTKKIIKKTDRRRSEYYTYFTGEEWDSAGNYDVRANMDLLGTDGSAKLLEALVRIKESK